MKEIKEGALVKAWDYDASDFVIGKYLCYDTLCEGHIIVTPKYAFMNNVIELPPELAKQLEELGNAIEVTYLVKDFDGIERHVYSVNGLLSLPNNEDFPPHWNGWKLEVDESRNSLWVRNMGFGQRLGEIVKTIYVDRAKQCAK